LLSAGIIAIIARRLPIRAVLPAIASAATAIAAATTAAAGILVTGALGLVDGALIVEAALRLFPAILVGAGLRRGRGGDRQRRHRSGERDCKQADPHLILLPHT